MDNNRRLHLPYPHLSIIAIITITISSFCFQSCRRVVNNGELVMMIEKRIQTFDPRVSSDSAAERMRQLIFNALTRKDDKFDPVADLAERYESSPDYKTFTFYLRPNVKFHNNKLLTSLDVKYTFETMLARGFASDKKAELVNALAGIDVKDDRTIVFRCNYAFPGFPNAIVPIGIIPEGSTELQAKRPVGTGPFKFSSYTEDQEVTLSAFPEYFEGAPSIKGLRIKIIPDNSTRESELRKGSVDLAINADFDPVTVEGLQKAQGINVEIINGTNIAHIGVNLLDPILKDIRVRQAIAYAIDREAIIRDIWRGQAKVAYSALPTSQWAYEPQVEKYAYNPDRAKQLLDEAGRKEVNGRPRLKLSMKTSTVSITRKVGEAIQEHLRRIGVQLDLQPLERQKLTQDLSEGNFQLYYNISVGGNQSTDFFKFAYSTQSIPPNGQNRSRYSNPQIDKLLIESQTAPRERQKRIFSDIQKLLAIDLPHIYLWYPATIVVSRGRVTNLKLEPSGDWQVVRNMKLTN